MPARLPDSLAGLPPVGGGFVGREGKLDRLGALLVGSARLVTLIGSGGIGKTRDQTYADVEKRGSRLSPECFEVYQIALGTMSINASSVDHPDTKPTSSHWQTLSKTEREVAILAAAGWPNTAIAVRRKTSTRTTGAQMSSIFQKLMINSRENIERFIPEDQRERVSAERSRIPRQS
jgi:DNA-binding CsgD family transcriptional regulator